MRIERGDHAADRFLHELLVVHVVHVLALDALVDFGEQARLLPRKCGRRLHGFVRPALGLDVTGDGTGKTKHRSRDESDQRA